MRKLWLTGLALLVALSAQPSGRPVSPARADEPRTLVVASGEVSGLFYPEAGALCRLMQRDQAQTGLRCLVEPSMGSAANLDALRTGQAQVALVQSKVLEDAVKGVGVYQNKPFPELRSLFSLHGEAVVVLVARGAKIKSVADLKGKRVNIGHPGTFQRTMADALLAAVGLTPESLGAAQEMDLNRQRKALCDGELDAAVVAGLHPLTEVQDAMDECSADLLPIKESEVGAWLKTHPAFVRLSIPADDYIGLKERLPSFGLRAVAVTTSALPADDAYAVVRAVFGNWGPFRAEHPMLKGLDRKAMARDALVAPPHDGALRYYRENGLP